MRRRLFCLSALALLAACAETDPAPVTTEPPAPEPERVYSPGPIAWEQLSEEHRRRARLMLARHGEAVADEAALQARWQEMSPAQQRFAIRSPSRMAPPRDAARRGTVRRGAVPRGTATRGTRQATRPTPSGARRSTPPRPPAR